MREGIKSEIRASREVKVLIKILLLLILDLYTRF